MRTDSVELKSSELVEGLHPQWAVTGDFEQTSTRENPLVSIVEGRTTEQLAAAIVALPGKERLVLALHYFEELTFEELSDVLDLFLSDVLFIHRSALALLRAELKKLDLQLLNRAQYAPTRA